MKQVYFNDLVLPEIPWEYQIKYPHFALLVNNYSSYVELIGSTAGFYIQVDEKGGYVLKDVESKVNLRLRCTKYTDGTNGPWVDQNNTQYSGWNIGDTRWVGWTNSYIPYGAADATDIYLPAMRNYRYVDYPMVYYNGMLLPEIPDSLWSQYPYAFIQEQAGRYNLCFSTQPYYFQASDTTLRPGSSAVNIWLTKEDLQAGCVWTYRNSSLYYYGQAQYPLWNNYDMCIDSIQGRLLYPRTTPVVEGSMTEPFKMAYLLSSGYQHLNTGIVPNDTTEVEIAYIPLESTDYGTEILWNDVWSCPVAYVPSGCFWSQRLGDWYASGPTPSLYNYYVVQAFPNNQIYINGELCGELPAGTNTSQVPLYMFMASEPTNTTSYASAFVVYYCKIWQDGQLVRDFIPAFGESGKCGMLDLVNNVMHYSETLYGFQECRQAYVTEEDMNTYYIINKRTLMEMANAMRYRLDTMKQFTPYDIIDELYQL